MMGQIIEKDLEPSMTGDLTVVKINVDEAPALAAKFGVMSIPALFCFKDGVKCAEFVGVTQASKIRSSF
jgi:thioredoxin 1